MLKQTFLFASVAALLIGFVPEAGAAPRREAVAPLMNPHLPPRVGPWMEGWYTRVSDASDGSSVAVVGASWLAKGSSFDPDGELPGYLAVLVTDARGETTRVFEEFPRRTRMRVHGQNLRPGVNTGETTDFEWQAEGLGTITHESLEVTLPGKATVRANFGTPLPWSGSAWGPEGMGGFMKLIPLHWFVYSMGSPAEYVVDLAGQFGERVEAGLRKGFAHQEKNWGKSFPQAWIWAQGLQPEAKAQFALAGGKLPLGLGGSITTWLVGYRSQDNEVSFSPMDPTVSYQVHHDARAGEFRIQANDARHVLRLSAKALPASFGPVSVPTRDGFTGKGIESFHAQVTVELLSNLSGATDPAPAALLPLETTVFENAALEYGGGYMPESAEKLGMERQ